jgi:Domain of unknown function (DUF4037)
MESSSAADERRRRLTAVARRFCTACPAELGGEIAVTGSLGAEIADEHSDLELLFLVDELPREDDVREWLVGLGADDVLVAVEGDGVSGWCRVDDLEIEPFWGSAAEVEREVSAILDGDVTDHGRLALAYVLTHCRILRSDGGLAPWQERLREYPAALQRRLIAAAAAGLEIPSPRLGGALRGDRLAVESFLLADAQRVLRIIFALNRRWEPPRWKWLSHHAETLETAPTALADRVVASLLEPNAVAAVRGMLELLRDALQLVPSEFEVDAARFGIERRLAALPGVSMTPTTSIR